jgi:hypothetical protein
MEKDKEELKIEENNEIENNDKKRYYCTFCKIDILQSSKKNHLLCITHIKNKKLIIQEQSKKCKQKLVNKKYYCECCKLEMPFTKKYYHNTTTCHYINYKDRHLNIRLNRAPILPDKKI